MSDNNQENTLYPYAIDKLIELYSEDQHIELMKNTPYKHLVLTISFVIMYDMPNRTETKILKDRFYKMTKIL